MMRFKSRGMTRSAEGGSTRASQRCNRSGPRFCAIASSRARSARVAARPGKQSARQRPVVEPGAADENRQLAAGRDVADRRRRFAGVARRRILLERIGNVDHVMGNALLLAGRHLVRADVETAIDGGGIAADDFAVQPARERDAERALAGRRGADDRDESRHVSSWLEECRRQAEHHAPRQRGRAAAQARTRASAMSAASTTRSPSSCVRDGSVTARPDSR